MRGSYFNRVGNQDLAHYSQFILSNLKFISQLARSFVPIVCSLMQISGKRSIKLPHAHFKIRWKVPAPFPILIHQPHQANTNSSICNSIPSSALPSWLLLHLLHLWWRFDSVVMAVHTGATALPMQLLLLWWKLDNVVMAVHTEATALLTSRNSYNQV